MIYVDAPIWPYRGMLMCHLMADSLDELHEMAVRLDVRRWFQNRPGKMPHYDICKSKRAQAVKLGAVEVDRRRTVAIMDEWKVRQAGGDPTTAPRTPVRALLETKEEAAR